MDPIKEFIVVMVTIVIVTVTVIFGMVTAILLINKCVNDMPCKVFLKDKVVSEQPLYLTEVKSSGDTTTVIVYKSWLQLGEKYQISDRNIKVTCEK